jgi:hypothetical protein
LSPNPLKCPPHFASVDIILNSNTMQRKASDVVRENWEEIRKIRSEGSSLKEFLIDLSKSHNVTYEALRKAEQRCRQTPIKHDKRFLLDYLEEISLVALIRDAALLGRPYDKYRIISLVRVWKDFEDSWDGLHWFHNFKSRYSDFLKEAKAKAITQARISPAILDATQRWVVQAEELFHQKAYPPDAIFNADETGFDPNFLGRDINVIVSTRTPMSYQLKYPKVDRISLVPFVSATGKLVMLVFIFPCSMKASGPDHAPLPLEFLTDARGYLKILYFFTPSGYMNAEIWVQICKEFSSHVSHLMPGLNKVLITDGLNAHKTDQSLSLLLDSNIQTLVLPENTTHVLQPLDQYPFANFKSIFARNWTRALRNPTNAETSPNALALIVMKKAILKALSPSSIVKSFRITGLVPFDKDIAISCVSNFLGKSEEAPLTLDEELIARADALIKAARGPPAAASTEVVKIKPQVNRAYTASSILEQAAKDAELKARVAQEKEVAREAAQKKKEETLALKRKRQEEAEERRQENKKRRIAEQEAKEAARALLRCSFCPSTCRGGQSWLVCSDCPSFRLCPRCAKDRYVDWMSHRRTVHPKHPVGKVLSFSVINCS